MGTLVILWRPLSAHSYSYNNIEDLGISYGVCMSERSCQIGPFGAKNALDAELDAATKLPKFCIDTHL